MLKSTGISRGEQCIGFFGTEIIEEIDQGFKVNQSERNRVDISNLKQE